MAAPYELTGLGVEDWDVLRSGISVGETKGGFTFGGETSEGVVEDVTQLLKTRVGSWISGQSATLEFTLRTITAATLAELLNWDENSGEIGPKYNQSENVPVPFIFKGSKTNRIEATLTPTAIVFTGVGSTADPCVGTASLPPIKPGTVSIVVTTDGPGSETFTDDGFGTLTGDADGTGTIDVKDGAISIVLGADAYASATEAYTHYTTKQLYIYIPQGVAKKNGNIEFNGDTASNVPIIINVEAQEAETRNRLFYLKWV